MQAFIRRTRLALKRIGNKFGSLQDRVYLTDVHLWKKGAPDEKLKQLKRDMKITATRKFHSKIAETVNAAAPILLQNHSEANKFSF